MDVVFDGKASENVRKRFPVVEEATLVLLLRLLKTGQQYRISQVVNRIQYLKEQTMTVLRWRHRSISGFSLLVKPPMLPESLERSVGH
jgi:hypothetical protein